MPAYIAHKLKRIALWLIILFACFALQLAALEAVLRWMDVGRTTRFLVQRDIGGKTWHTPNRAFYQQFSALPLDRIMTWDDLDFQVPAVKADNTVRIFVFGSSAVFGPHTSTRILDVMLSEAFPEVRWEIYNAACPGMNSHVMRAAAKACSALEPDLYLVYMGNNEAVGPFGPTTALGQSGLFWRPAVIRMLIALGDLRVSQALRANTAMVNLNLPEPDALMGMLPSMTDHHRALLYYADNLERICDAADRAGARVVLCTLAGNKRFMGTANREEPDFNGLSINGIVRDLAGRRQHTCLADVNKTVEAHSEDGLPGYDYFYDNVHFNFDGNYLAAKTMFDAVVDARSPLSAPAPLEPSRARPEPLSRDACAERLAWTDAAEFEQLRWQLQSFQDDYTRARTRERYEALQARLSQPWQEHMAADYQTALGLRPDDLYLRNACFRHYLNSGMLEEAEQQQRELSRYYPAARTGLRARALTADRRGDHERAVGAYRECLAHYPDDPESLKGLAERLFGSGTFAEAGALYRRYLREDPTDVFAWCRLGQIEEQQGQVKEAARTYAMIIETAPKHPLAHRLLDGLMMKTISVEERARHWDAMMERYPEAAEPYVLRGMLHAEAGEGAAALELLRKAAGLAPDDPAVQGKFGEIAYAQGAYAEAAQALREAIRLQPDGGHHRLLLIETLLAIGDTEGAREELATCDALGLNMPPDLRQRLQ